MSKMPDESFYYTRDLEIKIRGKYLRISASIEGLLTKCIIYLNEIARKSSKIDQEINFKNFTFGKKEEKFKELLKIVYIDLFQSNNQLFIDIAKFREMRNKMAHCYFTWNDSDLSYVTIWDLENHKNTPQKITPTNYNIEKIKEELDKSIASITNTLNALAQDIILRAEKEIPYMFN